MEYLKKYSIITVFAALLVLLLSVPAYADEEAKGETVIEAEVAVDEVDAVEEETVAENNASETCVHSWIV